MPTPQLIGVAMKFISLFVILFSFFPFLSKGKVHLAACGYMHKAQMLCLGAALPLLGSVLI